MRTSLSVLGLAAVLAIGCASTATAATPFPQASTSTATRPLTTIASNSQVHAPNGNFNIPFNWQRLTPPDICRVRSFFASDIAKPLEVVYFARHGTGCTGYSPSYGFVLLAR